MCVHFKMERTKDSMKRKALGEPVKVNEPKACCRALTKGCMACAAGLSVEDYCNKHPGKHGCAKKAVECNPKTGPSSGGCPMAKSKCTQCPPHKKCKHVTEYKETAGRCCPIPCNRIETDKPCPDAGRGWGECAVEKRPTDTETHRYLALSPKWVKSNRTPFTCCKVTEYMKVERGRVCCKAMTKECLACLKDITVDVFCAKHENSTYCPDYNPPATPTTPAEPTTVIATEPVSANDNDDTTAVEEVVLKKTDAEEEETSTLSAIIAGSAILGVLFMIS